MDKLLIVDGMNLHFQMFFGMPARIKNKAGVGIWGTLGFVGALLKIIKQTKPTHVAVIFDGEGSLERKQTDENYKANRPNYSTAPEDENPFTQLNDVYNALNYLNIKHCESCGCETDDIIAGYAQTYGKDMQIVISSYDSDFFQLINENVQIFRYRGDKSIICDSEYINEKFNISPNVYADFKSLTGDNADNVKGATKVGPKTASLLINKFGSLQNLLENAEKIEKVNLRETIINEKEKLKNNYKIIKLQNNCQLPFDINELKYSLKEGVTTNQVLKEIGL